MHAKWLKYVIVVSCCLLTLSIYANNTSKLTDLINKIKQLKSLLTQHTSAQMGAESRLKATETEINELSQALFQTSLTLKKHNLCLQRLNQRQQSLSSKINQQQRSLLQQIRFSYLLGLHKSKLQLLLQAQDPDRAQRLLTYNHYLNIKTQQLIQNLQTDLVLLNHNREEIIKQTQYYSQLKESQLARQKALDNNKEKQQRWLQQLSCQVKTQHEQLTQLLANKKNLEKVITKLQKKESYHSEFLTTHKGHFSWPTKGNIVEKFGSSIQQSELKQNGILIAATEGQPVYAIAPGKIIFANWMPGYGLLMIIDHGKGYMTLYGNNRCIYKKVATLVKDHELIATVGHTGGQRNKSALYFGLRYQGKPIDPHTWCH